MFNRRLQVLSPALRIHPTACTVRRRGTGNRARPLESGHESRLLKKSLTFGDEACIIAFPDEDVADETPGSAESSNRDRWRDCRRGSPPKRFD